VDVTLPDGTRVRASSIRERREHDPARSFGLYMDQWWRPTWPADMIAWPDRRVPANAEQAASKIEAAFARASRGELVEIGCFGGLGRTGTVLACMAVLAGVPPDEAVAWVRRNYDVRAVETPAQEDWVLWFSDRALRAQTEPR
jgi:Protein-tyrosine phosphatase